MAPSVRLMLSILSAGLLASQAAAAKCTRIPSAAKPVAAPGVSYTVLVNGLTSPRGAMLDPQGHLLVVEKGAGIKRLVLDDGVGLQVCVKSQTQIVADTSLNHGIALSADGKTLFASSSNDVFAYSYDVSTGTTGPGRSIITGMDQTDHVTRTLLIPKHHPNLLLVSRGSNDNVDNGTMQIGSGRSQIRTFDIKQLLANTSPVQYTAGNVLGWGLRNSVGVAEHPFTGNIWSVENSIDNMARTGSDIHNSNPGEELNFHGSPSDSHSKFYGKNYGYPQCVAIFDPTTVNNYPGGAAVGEQMTGDQTVAGTTDAYCIKQAIPPRITFNSHLAPLDIKFQGDGAGAFVSMHGSWNRQPPNGYRLSRVDFGRDGFPREPSTSTKAEVQLLWNADNSKCPGACFRPVGIVLDEGAGARGVNRIFMTSDATGEIYILTGAHRKALADDVPQQQAMNIGWNF